MHFTIVFAHGQQLISIFIGVVLFANIVAVTSIVVARRKEKDRISSGGLLLAVIGLLMGAWIFPLGISGALGIVYSIPVVAPALLSLCGLVMNLRRTKNA